MRRLSMLQPELDFTSSIAEKNALCVPPIPSLVPHADPGRTAVSRRDSLAAQVQEEVQEIHAEIAELSAAEAEEGAEAGGAAQ